MKSKVRPSDFIYEKFLKYLKDNNFPPGTKLPSEREISKMWNINRSTLRSALDRLENEGKLYIKKGSGIYVSTSKVIRNIQNSYSTTQTMSDIDGKFTSILLTEEKILANKQIAKSLKVRLGYDIYFIKRLRLLDNTPIMIESSFIKYEDYKLLKNINLETDSLYECLKNVGLEVVKGVETLELIKADKEVQNLLKINSSDFIFYQEGISYDKTGIPIEYFQSSYNGKLISFESWIT